MKVGRVFWCVLASTLLLALPAGLPEARAEYMNGSFLGVFTNPGGEGSFTLQVDAGFPQVTSNDHVPPPGDNRVVTVKNGARMDFYLNASELGGEVRPGEMRFTLFQLDAPEGPKILVLGTYTLTTDDGDGPYQVSGPVVGDAYTLYLPGRLGDNTPGDPTDDALFLIKVHATGAGVDPSDPDYLMGRAQIVVGKRVLSPVTEDSATTTTAPGLGAALDAPGLLDGTRFTQFAPADGSADEPLAGDTAAAFISGVKRSGTIGAGSDPYATTAAGFRLMPGGTPDIGIAFSRSTRTLPGGKTVEGFSVVDIEPAVAGISALEGYVFSFVTGRSAPALLFGTIVGSVTSTGATATSTTELAEVDSAPPEIFPVTDTPDLFTGSYRGFQTVAWDFNGWQDLTSEQLLINDSQAANRILARYDARTNRLSLYNKAIRRWVGRCNPGNPSTLRTPWVSLSCKDTEVFRFSEILVVNWSLQPTAKMLPVSSLHAYVKATDRSGQVAGWRMIGDLDVFAGSAP